MIPFGVVIPVLRTIALMSARNTLFKGSLMKKKPQTSTFLVYQTRQKKKISTLSISRDIKHTVDGLLSSES